MLLQNNAVATCVNGICLFYAPCVYLVPFTLFNEVLSFVLILLLVLMIFDLIPGDVVVHIFLPPEREFYNLEEFYANATPIDLPFENQPPFHG